MRKNPWPAASQAAPPGAKRACTGGTAIRQLYNEPPVRLSRDGMDYLQAVANDLGRGSLRRCKMLLQNAARRARKRQGSADGDKVTVTADDLEWVETRLRQESGEQEAAKDRRRRAVGAASG